jgi:hypothetical protein
MLGNGVRKSAVWKKPAHAGTESPTPIKLGSGSKGMRGIANAKPARPRHSVDGTSLYANARSADIAICTQLNQKAGWDGKKSCDQPTKLAQSTNCTDKNLARKLLFVTAASRRSWEMGAL